ncbi:MAG: c-type cytochrome biogenesis protein CcsB [Gammaproteobacteria bacterium]|nr:c-type cytochrome biogenesis protein CcsB [Gammaproteobacteria bacterium]
MRELIERPPFLKTLLMRDWLFALLAMVGAIFSHVKYSVHMDAYEVGILYLSAATLIAIAWHWRAIGVMSLIVGLLSIMAILIYDTDLSRADSSFFLKYLISSQSAIMWMSALYVLATVTYFLGLFRQSEFTNKVASGMVWSGTAMGFIGLMVRWRESYLIHPDVGHIPVSNLYEVFVLFAVLTALIYLHYERRYMTRALGGFVMLIVSASVGFLLWYSYSKGAHEIQPLVPALKSYWMKIHVPTNFIGYGAFALAAMVGVAYLLLDSRRKSNPDGFFASRMPDLEILDDVMYKSIALGFAFFTIATVLGAMWAAEAWGGYWSWDPKETWALIVWLNYAAWLHLRLTKGWRGRPLAWWAIVGLFVTLFAFLGVNMFLSGLHSYGEL